MEADAETEALYPISGRFDKGKQKYYKLYSSARQSEAVDGNPEEKQGKAAIGDDDFDNYFAGFWGSCLPRIGVFGPDIDRSR
jgi:hypothetical protein